MPLISKIEKYHHEHRFSTVDELEVCNKMVVEGVARNFLFGWH